jgi:hypothetical protein
MVAFLPAAEACDVHLTAESPARTAIKSIVVIFMFLSYALRFVCSPRDVWASLSIPEIFQVYAFLASILC